ncbi:MAG: murein biosynthesis integral membrane protein MurJ [Clostridiales bacterium]|nr:murein biosynthesis integral membrane protein MurJ [Clostridiales bacterium]
MKRIILQITLLTVFANAIGYLKDIVLAYYYGTSVVSDTYIIAITVPTIMYSFFGAAISAGFIPKYSEIRKKSLKEANDFTSNLFVFSTIFALLIIALIIGFTEPILKIFASGFDHQTLSLAISFTRITAFSILVSGAIGIYKGVLNINNIYWAPVFMAIPKNVILILFIVLSNHSYEFFLPFGFVVGTLVEILILTLFTNKTSFRFTSSLKFQTKDIFSFVVLVLPIFFSIAVNDINKIIDRTIASNLQVGAISALSYAEKFNGMIQGILVASVTTAMFPLVSNYAATGRTEDMKSSIRESIIIITLLVLPASVGLIIYSRELVSLLYGRGSFTSQSIEITASALVFYSIGMLSFSLRQVLLKSFYAMRIFNASLINSMLTVTLNVVLNLFFYYQTDLGVKGLALATSTSGIIASIFLMIKLDRKLGDLVNYSLFKSLMKIAFATVVMSIGGVIAYKILLAYFNLPQNLIIIYIVSFSVVVYFLSVIILKVEEVMVLRKLLVSKLFGRFKDGSTLKG